jgi:hypothetical protein
LGEGEKPEPSGDGSLDGDILLTEKNKPPEI